MIGIITERLAGLWTELRYREKTMGTTERAPKTCASATPSRAVRLPQRFRSWTTTVTCDQKGGRGSALVDVTTTTGSTPTARFTRPPLARMIASIGAAIMRWTAAPGLDRLGPRQPSRRDRGIRHDERTEEGVSC